MIVNLTNLDIMVVHTLWHEPVYKRYRAGFCSLAVFMLVVAFASLLVIPYAVSYAAGGKLHIHNLQSFFFFFFFFSFFQLTAQFQR